METTSISTEPTINDELINWLIKAENRQHVRVDIFYANYVTEMKYIYLQYKLSFINPRRLVLISKDNLRIKLEPGRLKKCEVILTYNNVIIGTKPRRKNEIVFNYDVLSEIRNGNTPTANYVGYKTLEDWENAVKLRRRENSKNSGHSVLKSLSIEDGIKMVNSLDRFDRLKDLIKIAQRDGFHCCKCKEKVSKFLICGAVNNPNKMVIHMYSDRDIVFTADHILPVGKGGSDTIENKQLMCRPCNEEKSDLV